MDDVRSFFVNILAYGGGSATVAYLLFRFLGEKWIENKFEKQLEEDRHTHAKELQDLKNDLDSELNRVLKIQEKEFIVLSEAWEKLKIAENAMGATVALGRMGINFDSMAPKELDDFLTNAKFMELHKEQLKSSKDKSKFYSEIIVRYDLAEALRTFHDFLSYIRRNSIFVRPNLEETFLEIEEKMRETISLKQTEQIMNGTMSDVNFARDAFNKMEKEIIPLIESLKKEIRTALHKDE